MHIHPWQGPYVKPSCYVSIISEIFHKNIRNLMLFRLITNMIWYTASDSSNRTLCFRCAHPSSLHQPPQIPSLSLFFCNSRWWVFLTGEFNTACLQGQKMFYKPFSGRGLRNMNFAARTFLIQKKKIFH